MENINNTLIYETSKQKGLLHRFSSNFGWTIIGEIGGKGIFFFVTVYLARVLGVKNYGIFTLAQTIVYFFWLAVDLGVNMYGSREIAKDKKNVDHIVNSLLTIRILSGFIVFTIFVTLTYSFITNPLQKFIFLGCALYLIARSINTDWVLRGLEIFKYIAFGNFATFLSMILLMFLIIKDKDDVIKASFIWSLCYFLGGSVLLLILFKKLKIKYKPVLKIQTLFSHIKESIHFTVSRGFLSLFQYLPLIYLGIFSTDYDVGLFSAPFRMITATTFVVSILQMAVFPIFADLYFSNREKFKKLHRLYWFISIAFGIAIGIFGTLFREEIMLFIYGDLYINSSFTFGIMIWFVSLISLRVVYGVVFAASGLQKFYSLAAISGVLLVSTIFFALKFIFNIPDLISASISLVTAEVGILIILASIWKFKREKAC
jgi:O-antigen/teichoic acid export membrane protein